MLSAPAITALLTLTAAGQACAPDMCGTAIVVRGKSVASTFDLNGVHALAIGYGLPYDNSAWQGSCVGDYATLCRSPGIAEGARGAPLE